MKLLRVGAPGQERPALRTDDGRLLDLSSVTPDIDGAFLAAGGVDRARAAVEAGTPTELPTEGLRVGAHVARPGKVVCVGLNYRDHAAETGADIPSRPVIFMKAPSTVVGPYDEVLIPRGSVKTDWEVELAVVIGRRARYLEGPEDAAEVIAGYTVSHDVSEREFQLEYSSQWDLGKIMRDLQPARPLAGHRRRDRRPAEPGTAPECQRRRTPARTHPRHDLPGPPRRGVPEPVHGPEPGRRDQHRYAGTPAGVALGLPGTPFLRPGDTVELEIDGLGGRRQTFGHA